MNKLILFLIITHIHVGKYIIQLSDIISHKLCEKLFGYFTLYAFLLGQLLIILKIILINGTRTISKESVDE